MKTLAMFFVSFFLALGLARAQEETVQPVQPEAYTNRVLPGVMIVMQRGNTVWGTCRQIEADGNLPIERVKDYLQCTKMVAENHTGKTGDVAMEAAKKIKAGEAVFFPFNVVAVVTAVETKDQQIEAQKKDIADLENELTSQTDIANELGLELNDRDKLEAGMRAEIEMLRKTADFGEIVNRLSMVLYDSVRQNTNLLAQLATERRAIPMTEFDVVMDGFKNPYTTTALATMVIFLPFTFFLGRSRGYSAEKPAEAQKEPRPDVLRNDGMKEDLQPENVLYVDSPNIAGVRYGFIIGRPFYKVYRGKTIKCHLLDCAKCLAEKGTRSHVHSEPLQNRLDHILMHEASTQQSQRGSEAAEQLH